MQVATGYSEVVVAGGMESMSGAPHLLPGVRAGLRYGSGTVDDALDKDALVCGFDGLSMGAATERYQAGNGFTRADQDNFAAESHARAADAIKAGRLAEEITPVTVRGRKGEVIVEDDEGVRPGITAERLGALPPAFSADGTITAGSASQLSDGACAVVVMGRDRAGQLGLEWLAELGAYGTVAGPDPSLLLQPARAIRDALRRDGTLGLDDLDLIEINEAFAGVGLASTRDLGVPADRVNVNGGAIALGHPVGMSGPARAHPRAGVPPPRRRNRGGGTGAAALCGGGGQGDALIVRVPGR
jgi:acetyl-CoA C-acetyltransferase